MGFDRARRTVEPVGGTATYEFARLLTPAECRGDPMRRIHPSLLHEKRASVARRFIDPARSECRLRRSDPRSSEDATSKNWQEQAAIFRYYRNSDVALR